MAIANRIGFITTAYGIEERNYNFEWFMGCSVAQLRRSIRALHKEIRNSGYGKIIEVSTKSEDEIGRKLSPLNLMVCIDDESLPMESCYQGSKVFDDNGCKVKLSECEYILPWKTKQFIRETVKERDLKLVEFDFKGNKFDLSSKGMCFDYIYILGLIQNESLGDYIMNYEVFTDLMFKKETGIGCQARSCALYKYLRTNGLLENFIKNPHEFKYIYN